MSSGTLEEVLRRRRVLVCVGAGGVGKTTLAAAVAMRAAALGRSALVCTIDPARRLANALGLTWLGKRQVLSGRHEGALGTGGYPGGVAVGSLSGLAFMCSGSSPGQGPFGKNIERAVKYMIDCGVLPVLIRVDNERAMEVGMKMGINMYQGFLIDDMVKKKQPQPKADFGGGVAAPPPA